MHTDQQQPRPARDAYYQYAQQLKDRRGANFSELARQISTEWESVDRATVRAAITGLKGGRPLPLPREDTVKRLDEALGAEGTLLARWQAAVLEATTLRLGMAAPATPAEGSRHLLPDPAGPTGEDTTNRRTFVTLGTLGVLAATATERSREIAGADPDPATMIEIEEDIDRFAEQYTLLPHAVLLPAVIQRWRQVDAALGRRTTLSVRNRLTAAAGRLTYYLSRLSFNSGDFRAALRLAALAEQYATQVGDTVILSSAAGIASGVAFYRHQYDAAVAAFTTPDPPHLRARNAAYRARAHAARGDVRSALAELDVMRSGPLAAPPQPGDLPLTHAAADMFSAVTLVRCGDGQAAEQYARNSIAAHEAAGDTVNTEEFGHALCVLAGALLQRERPEPEEAAALGRRALTLLDGRPTHTVLLRAHRLSEELRPYRLPAVSEFHEQLQAAPRPVLTSGR